ncbi:glycosyltransferase 87 family protein [Cellulomonas sp. S1-8]|uniref:glycosyltransferase 87 family protein n=1 Tax=Cellulomonas sp. S1-8 TaxID=2904790 RepID=UPI002242C8C2|nr:glycosyltransferase 87 family protein [Cellulomonas sp. S1-8]UZN02905.1 glycosyltransferase 87 family protein [Cellulomonas sp. S1-8]
MRLRTPLVWLLFVAVHAWLTYLGVSGVSGAFGDVDLYRRWMRLGLELGHWPVLDGPWVYPVGALLPMLLPAVVGATPDAPYALAWSGLVVLLDAVAVAFLLRRPSGRTAATWWLGFLLLLGPVAVGRLDGLVAPLTVVALLVALTHPRTSAALLTAGTWIKVAPAAAGLPLLLAARRPWRDVVLPGLAVSAAVVGTVVALGGGDQVASFVLQQEARGLQLEAVAATPWLVAGLVSSEIRRTFHRQLVTFEIHGPGTQGTADALGVVLLLTVLAAAALLWWCRRRDGARFWSDDVLRGDFVVRGAFLLSLVLIVANKVGSPQYIAWLAPPVAVALALGRPWWRRTAVALLVVAAATQWVFPWWYADVIHGLAFTTLVLAARNVALVALLVVAVAHLVRPPEPAGSTA